MYAHTHKFPGGETADIWQLLNTEQQVNPLLYDERLVCVLRLKRHVTSQRTWARWDARITWRADMHKKGKGKKAGISCKYSIFQLSDIFQRWIQEVSTRSFMFLKLPDTTQEGLEVFHSTVAPLWIQFYQSGQAKSPTKTPEGHLTQARPYMKHREQVCRHLFFV